MMKISKLILTNDLMNIPVQFTSLNSVLFLNVKNVYDGNENIILEYEHQSKIDASSRDWIGIFPRGWNSLQQYVTFEWVSQSITMNRSEQNEEKSGEIIKKSIAFFPKYHINAVYQNTYYQFAYVSKQIEVLGTSNYFRFNLTNVNDIGLELECLVPVSSKIPSTSVSDLGTLLNANESSSTSLECRALHATSIHSLLNLDPEGRINHSRVSLPINFADGKRNSLLSKKPPVPKATGDSLDPYSSHSEPVFPMSVQMTQCKKCFQFKRGGDFIRSQQVVQSKLKIVMERNKVLEERSQEMKKELEKLRAESKRMKMSFYTVNKEKVTYEKFVKDFIKSLEKDSVVRVMYENSEILVKKVNYVGMEEHPRDKKTSKRERELKAVIGLQEITIRHLINSLQEKAKSVQELNKTVKLAQVFSATENDSKDSVSDCEESSDEVSQSEPINEYEFSLSKPQPPEDVEADADEVLNDIRRKTETELKDIGINRSMGENSSRGSETDLELTKLSVETYHSKDEETKPKKPRLTDNVEDSWPSSIQAKSKTDSLLPVTNDEPVQGDMMELPVEPDVTNEMKEFDHSKEETFDVEMDSEVDASICEDYYDAYDAFSVRSSVVENDKTEAEEISSTYEEQTEDEKTFSMTAVIPRNFDIEPATSKSENDQKSKQNQNDQGKKFTCEVSIDFSPKKTRSEEIETTEPAIENGKAENQIITLKENGQEVEGTTLKREKSLITFKKSDECFEIQIVQIDETENSSKIHQKMVVKFAGSGNVTDRVREDDAGNDKTAPEFEFNLALTGSGESKRKEENQEVDTPRTLSEISDRTEEVEEPEEAKLNTTPSTTENRQKMPKEKK